MGKKQPRRPARGTLEWCLSELRWLEAAQEDPSVDEETWRVRGNALLASAAELPPRSQDRFHAAWEAFQRREAERTGMPVLSVPEGAVPSSVEQEQADLLAYERVAELLRRHREGGL